MQTTQEYFNDIATHLLKQMRKSVDSEGDCTYRGSDGVMCAIGCKIPDEVYNKQMEYKEVGAMIFNHPELREHLWPGEVECHGETLNRRLQDLHDLSKPKSWRRGLELIARDFGLEMPKI